MQQECLAQIIMTSERDASSPRDTSALPCSRLRALLAGCAALPDDAPVVEQLDEETGVTIARLGHPIELYRETCRTGPTAASHFSVRSRPTRWASASCTCGSRCRWKTPARRRATGDHGRMAPRSRSASAGRSADFAGLRQSPYKIPTPWIAMFYFRVDADIVARLGAARDLGVQVSENTARRHRCRRTTRRSSATTRACGNLPAATDH